jgi:hypothetical protein
LIDQICINQNDNAEKSVQVAMMGDIYSNAESVLVWLGDAQDKDASQATQLLPSVMANIFVLSQEGRDVITSLHDHPSLQRGVEVFPPESHPVWSIFYDLLSNQWQRRLWVMQEAILAKELHILYGAVRLEWHHFTSLEYTLRMAPFIKSLDVRWKEGGSTSVVNLLEILNRYRRDYRRTKANKSSLSFSDLLLLNGGRDCTLEIDRIYALLGILHERQRSQIDVDYSKRISDVYLHAFKVAIASDPYLMLLYYRNSGEDPYQLPSWCPNLRGQSRRNTLFSRLYSAGTRMNQTEIAPTSVVTTSPNTRIINIRGIEVDHIRAIGPCYISGAAKSEQEHCILQTSEFVVQCIRLAYPGFDANNNNTVPDSFFRTLIADQIGQSTEASRASSVQIQHLRQSLDFFSLFGGAIERVPSGAAWTTATEFLLEMQRACAGRRFFTTKNGRTGLGPDECLPGDVICTFLGGLFQFILRPVDNSESFTLVGESYVHGLMDAEALDMLDAGKMQLQDFAIE